MKKNISYHMIEKKPLKLWGHDYLKNYLRITHDYDDELIISLLEAAIEMAENYTGLSLHQRVMRIHVKQAISASVYLKHAPILDILEANHIRNDQRKEKINPGDIELDASGNLIHLNKTLSGKEIEMIYVAGHQMPGVGINSTGKIYHIEVKQVPFPVQTAILLLLEKFYERGIEDNVSHYEALKYLLPYRQLKI